MELFPSTSWTVSTVALQYTLRSPALNQACIGWMTHSTTMCSCCAVRADWQQADDLLEGIDMEAAGIDEDCEEGVDRDAGGVEGEM